jgi:pyruvate, water dikinase
MLLKNLFRHWTYQVFSPGTVLREKYEAFKSLLENDKCAHEVMAELEEIYHNQTKVDFRFIEAKYAQLSTCVLQIIANLLKMCPTHYQSLRDYFKKFDSYVHFMLAPPAYDFAPPFTYSLAEIPSEGLILSGGKAFNLATIGRNLQLPIPAGFVIATSAFYYFIEFNNLRSLIDDRLAQLDINSTVALDDVSHEIMAAFIAAQVPAGIEQEIRAAYADLQKTSGLSTKVAMRSSAVGEDSQSSFAGQYRTLLNIGPDAICDAYKKVIASKYSSNAIYYRINYGLTDIETPMAVLALEMINAKANGIIYTENIEDRRADQMKIHATWGLGELLVSGKVSPDVFTVSKDKNPRIIDKHIAVKSKQMINSPNGMTEVKPLEGGKRSQPSLPDKSALVLADYGLKLEDYFNEPQDIEWCLDEKDRIFFMQSRPLRKGEDNPNQSHECNFENFENAKIISGGDAASAGIGAGRVYKIDHTTSLENLPQGSVLVAQNASPRYVKVMNRLNAVITDTGSTAGHFSSVAREFGVPALVNTGNATTNLTHGGQVTVHADGKAVYEGILQPMLDSPCAGRDLISDSPFMRKMKSVMSFISQLELVDPGADNFTPEGCRSLHDIIRFCHEKAVKEMFHIGDRRLRKIGGAKKLVSDIPMSFYVIDVGDALQENSRNQKSVTINEIRNLPLKALLKGLSHPGIQWSDFTHFDWAEHDKIVMGGGIISPEDAMFASHAVISRDYMNLNLRFGYHFVIVDTLCSKQSEDNYILFRFSGGGADFDKRMLRADFLGHVLHRIGFEVIRKSDLIDAELKGQSIDTLAVKLDLIGRLLGATRLMDMYLKDATAVEGFVEDFMNGRYHFATIDE